MPDMMKAVVLSFAVPGLHFIYEDSGVEIDQAIRRCIT